MTLVLNSTASDRMRRSRRRARDFPEKAEAAGFITVAPERDGAAAGVDLAGSALPGVVDDFSFVRRLLDRLEESLCIDTSRVYATGMSNGAGLTSLLARASSTTGSRPWCRWRGKASRRIEMQRQERGADTRVSWDGRSAGVVRWREQPARDTGEAGSGDLNLDFASLVNRQQCRNRDGIEPFSGKILDDL